MESLSLARSSKNSADILRNEEPSNCAILIRLLDGNRDWLIGCTLIPGIRLQKQDHHNVAGHDRC